MLHAQDELIVYMHTAQRLWDCGVIQSCVEYIGGVWQPLMTSPRSTALLYQMQLLTGCCYMTPMCVGASQWAKVVAKH